MNIYSYYDKYLRLERSSDSHVTIVLYHDGINYSRLPYTSL